MSEVFEFTDTNPEKSFVVSGKVTVKTKSGKLLVGNTLRLGRAKELGVIWVVESAKQCFVFSQESIYALEDENDWFHLNDDTGVWFGELEPGDRLKPDHNVMNFAVSLYTSLISSELHPSKPPILAEYATFGMITEKPAATHTKRKGSSNKKMLSGYNPTDSLRSSKHTPIKGASSRAHEMVQKAASATTSNLVFRNEVTGEMGKNPAQLTNKRTRSSPTSSSSPIHPSKHQKTDSELHQFQSSGERQESGSSGSRVRSPVQSSIKSFVGSGGSPQKQQKRPKASVPCFSLKDQTKMVKIEIEGGTAGPVALKKEQSAQKNVYDLAGGLDEMFTKKTNGEEEEVEEKENGEEDDQTTPEKKPVASHKITNYFGKKQFGNTANTSFSFLWKSEQKGFYNMGNTCYMNSILSSLVTLTPFTQRLVPPTPPAPTISDAKSPMISASDGGGGVSALNSAHRTAHGRAAIDHKEGECAMRRREEERERKEKEEAKRKREKEKEKKIVVAVDASEGEAEYEWTTKPTATKQQPPTLEIPDSPTIEKKSDQPKSSDSTPDLFAEAEDTLGTGTPAKTPIGENQTPPPLRQSTPTVIPPSPPKIDLNESSQNDDTEDIMKSSDLGLMFAGLGSGEPGPQPEPGPLQSTENNGFQPILTAADKSVDHQPPTTNGNNNKSSEKEKVKKEEEKSEKSCTCDLGEKCVFCQMVELTKECLKKDRMAQRPIQLKRAVALHRPEFGSFRQQDAHEFLVTLLDTIHEDNKRVICSQMLSSGQRNGGSEPKVEGSNPKVGKIFYSSKSKAGGRVSPTRSPTLSACSVPTTSSPEKRKLTDNERQLETLLDQLDPITQVFSGEVLYTFECSECGEKGSKTEKFTDVSLDMIDVGLFDSISVQRLFDSFFMTRLLERKCEKCGNDLAYSSPCLSTLPLVLVLHLKRFEPKFSFDGIFQGYAKRDENVVLNTQLAAGHILTGSDHPYALKHLWNKPKPPPSKSEREKLFPTSKKNPKKSPNEKNEKKEEVETDGVMDLTRDEEEGEGMNEEDTLPRGGLKGGGTLNNNANQPPTDGSGGSKKPKKSSSSSPTSSSQKSAQKKQSIIVPQLSNSNFYLGGGAHQESRTEMWEEDFQRGKPDMSKDEEYARQLDAELNAPASLSPFRSTSSTSNFTEESGVGFCPLPLRLSDTFDGMNVASTTTSDYDQETQRILDTNLDELEKPEVEKEFRVSGKGLKPEDCAAYVRQNLKGSNHWNYKTPIGASLGGVEKSPNSAFDDHPPPSERDEGGGGSGAGSSRHRTFEERKEHMERMARKRSRDEVDDSDGAKEGEETPSKIGVGTSTSNDVDEEFEKALALSMQSYEQEQQQKSSGCRFFVPDSQQQHHHQSYDLSTQSSENMNENNPPTTTFFDTKKASQQQEGRPSTPRINDMIDEEDDPDLKKALALSMLDAPTQPMDSPPEMETRTNTPPPSQLSKRTFPPLSRNTPEKSGSKNSKSTPSSDDENDKTQLSRLKKKYPRASVAGEQDNEPNLNDRGEADVEDLTLGDKAEPPPLPPPPAAAAAASAGKRKKSFIDTIEPRCAPEAKGQDSASLISNCPNPYLYELHSAVHHRGMTAHSGHYICDVRDERTNRWKCWDDSTISEISESDALGSSSVWASNSRQKTAYILFYVRKDILTDLQSKMTPPSSDQVGGGGGGSSSTPGAAPPA